MIKRKSKKQRLEAAARWYDLRLAVHQRLARKLKDTLSELLTARQIQFDRVEARVKERKSFHEKAGKTRAGGGAKYRDPINDIKDVVGVRVITYLESMVQEVGKLVESEFSVDQQNSIDKREALGVDRVGYRSKHYVATLDPKRASLPECVEFKDIPFEIQIRSLLQHAWSEMEHDRRFKAQGELPNEIRRRFSLLAAALETADRDFDSLAREVDSHAARVARDAQGSKAAVALTTENTLAYLRGALAEQTTNGTVDSGLAGDEATEMVAELAKFGVKNLGELGALLPRDFTSQFPETIREPTTFVRLLRAAMILKDHKRYFESAKARMHWATLTPEEVEFFQGRGVIVYDDAEVEWLDGPEKAVKAALEDLVWDLERRVVRAPNPLDDDHHQDGSMLEFKSKSDLLDYLSEIGFEPYNASAPRNDGEWVFVYDDEMAEELLDDRWGDQLTEIGWS